MLAAERLGRRDAVGRAVRRDGAALAAAHHARGRQLGDGVHRALGGVGRALADLGRALASADSPCCWRPPRRRVVHLLLGAAQVVAEVGWRPASNQRPIASNTPGCLRRRLASARTAAAGGGAASWAKAQRRRQHQPRRQDDRAGRRGGDHAADWSHGHRSEALPRWRSHRPALPANLPECDGEIEDSAQNKYSAATMPTTSTTAPSVTQNPSRSSMMARAWGP